MSLTDVIILYYYNICLQWSPHLLEDIILVIYLHQDCFPCFIQTKESSSFLNSNHESWLLVVEWRFILCWSPHLFFQIGEEHSDFRCENREPGLGKVLHHQPLCQVPWPRPGWSSRQGILSSRDPPLEDIPPEICYRHPNVWKPSRSGNMPLSLAHPPSSTCIFQVEQGMKGWGERGGAAERSFQDFFFLVFGGKFITVSA